MYSNYLLMLHGEINRPRFVSEKILCLTKELWHTYYVMTYMYIVNWGRNLSLSSKSVCRSNQNKLDHIKCKLSSYCSILIGQDMANLLYLKCLSIDRYHPFAWALVLPILELVEVVGPARMNTHSLPELPL